MKFYYINHVNEKIDLGDYPYIFQSGDLLDYTWNYDSDNNKISNIRRDLKKYKVKIAVLCDISLPVEERRSEFGGNVNRLVEVFEKDVLENENGRLYTDSGAYLSCMIMGSTKADWNMGIPFMFNDLTLVAEYPAWVTETPYVFKVSDPVTTNNKKYAYRYSYRYANGLNNATIINDHFAPAHFRLIFYGPCTNPHVIIGEHRYQVNILLEQGEYLTVDSRSRTVKKTMVNGTVVNAFHNRSFQDSVFEKIPPGTSTVSWPGTFDFDLTLLAERSEPEWT